MRGQRLLHSFQVFMVRQVRLPHAPIRIVVIVRQSALGTFGRSVFVFLISSARKFKSDKHERERADQKDSQPNQSDRQATEEFNDQTQITHQIPSSAFTICHRLMF